MYFGLYGLANIVQSSMTIVTQSVGQVIYPRMAIMYGKGDAPGLIIKRNLRPLFFLFLFTFMIVITGVILLPTIIPIILPQYIDGIKAAQWILFVSLVSFFRAINNIYNVTKQQKYYFIALICGALVGTAYIYFRLAGAEFNLMVFPQGMIIGALVQQVIGIFFAFRLK